MYAISSLCTLAHIRDHVCFPADFGAFTICGDKVVVVTSANCTFCIARHCFVLSNYNKQNPWEYDCSDVYMISGYIKPPHPFCKLPPTHTHLKKIVSAIKGGWEQVGGITLVTILRLKTCRTNLFTVSHLFPPTSSHPPSKFLFCKTPTHTHRPTHTHHPPAKIPFSWGGYIP